jgi:arylsulfatase A-like enzyme
LIDSGTHSNWDAHGDMQDHRPKARRVDRALAGLLTDLQQCGLWDDTLIAICTEFGRTPTTFNGAGREHFIDAFSSLLCGGGVRGGMTYGETDEYGMKIVADPCHVHDYHATILHLLGLDHERVTYRYAGRDFRLTDVAGNVLTRIFA